MIATDGRLKKMLDNFKRNEQLERESLQALPFCDQDIIGKPAMVTLTNK